MDDYPRCRVCGKPVVQEGLIFADGTASHFECCGVSKDMAMECFPHQPTAVLYGQSPMRYLESVATNHTHPIELSNTDGTVTVTMGREQFHTRELDFKPSRVPDTLREWVEDG